MRFVALAAALALAGCSSILPSKLPEKRPPLADMEEPLALLDPPNDEAERALLPLGGFTGIYVADARRTLDEMEEEAPGVRVARVVENSPGDAAGVEEGDLLVAATDAAGVKREISYPSQWREVEIAAAPGGTLRVVVDRAGAVRTAEVGVVARTRAPGREAPVRLREEDKVGVVLRSATEVEARAAGLGPGGGAVVVGLSAASPWRAAGLRFGDLLTSVDGVEVAHPQVVLDAVRAAEKEQVLHVEFARAGAKQTIDAPVSARAAEVSTIDVPILFSYESDRGDCEWSALLGLVSYRSTIAAWEMRLLWLLKFGAGDSGRLVEVAK
jgi:membrane-associated protease RseP (regulator of RpoE activity)